MTAPSVSAEYRAVVTRNGRLADSADIENVCDGDEAARRRRQYSRGIRRSLTRVVLVPVVR